MDVAGLLGERADPALLLRAFYLAASALILAIRAVPAWRTRFLPYGSRATPPSPALPEKTPPGFHQVLDYLAGFTVPHSYFTHFYYLSVLCSLFWGWTLGLSVETSKVAAHVQLAWLLMLLQGLRRMAESYTFMSASKSRMWFGHWILGLLFYVTVNVAIWIDGAPTPSDPSAATGDGQGFQNWKLAVLPPAILTCHALQHSYHKYLYHLRTTNSTYQLPSHPLFPNLLCPHYTCETLIYLLLSFLAAPAGRAVNWTLLCATVFVAVNLGVTASGTKDWYEQRFGVGKVRGRRKMVPWIW